MHFAYWAGHREDEGDVGFNGGHGGDWALRTSDLAGSSGANGRCPRKIIAGPRGKIRSWRGPR